MPEGDTIHRAARRLKLAIGGRVVTSFQSVFPQLLRVDEDAPVGGRTVEDVRSVGKNLLMDFSGALTLRTHMRMNGSWHIYRPGESWRRRRVDMRIVIETSDYLAVGFGIPVAEFLTPGEAKRHPDLRRVGPDVLGDLFDREEAWRRIRARPHMEIADALLNQRVIAGIGNVFKSEVLFEGGIDPFRRVATLSDDEIERLMRIAEKQMRLNIALASASRMTTGRLKPGERLWVYGRGGEPCFRCGTAILRRRQGRDARSTYWCPLCQR
jgi:endonuclease VIII